MKDWFMNLETRERMLLVTGAAALLVFLVFVGLWRPLIRGVDKLETTVNEQRATLQWMLSAGGELRALQANKGNQVAGLGEQSLLAVVDQSARSLGLGPALKRVEPEGSDAVRVWLEKAEFDKLITWMSDLSTRYSVTIGSITVERNPEQGLVNSRVTLMEPPRGT